YTEGGLITDDESANRITWSELKDEGLKVFKVTLNAQAIVNLGMTLSVSDNANFPRITADLNLDWQHSCTLIGGKDETPDADGGGGDGAAVAAVIDTIETVGDLIHVMSLVPDDANVYLPLGNFWLAKTSNGPFGRPGEGTTIYYDNSEVHAPSITQRNQSLIA